MSSRAEQYRRGGIEARKPRHKQPIQTSDFAFEAAARGWFALAEQVAWLDRRHDVGQQAHKKE
jgi:hypothetical protein